MHWGSAMGGEASRMTSNTTSIDDGDTGPIYGDCLALGMEFHSGSCLCCILKNKEFVYLLVYNKLYFKQTLIHEPNYVSIKDADLNRYTFSLLNIE